jgi:isocitrate dehydrogenase
MKVGTQAFSKAIIERLGKKPKQFKAVELNHNAKPITIKVADKIASDKQLIGIDVFLDWSDSAKNPEILGSAIKVLTSKAVELNMISNRGVVVYPNGHPSTFCTNHWRCRFTSPDKQSVSFDDLLSLQLAIHQAGFKIIKTENLYLFDGRPGYSMSQGEK